jgi:hypothetical protein
MAEYVAGYSLLVDAVVPYEDWDEAYFALLSLKAHYQSLPGYQGMDIHARDLESGDIKVTITTMFELADQILVWLQNDITPEGLLRVLDPPPLVISSDVREIVV